MYSSTGVDDVEVIGHSNNDVYNITMNNFASFTDSRSCVLCLDVFNCGRHELKCCFQIICIPCTIYLTNYTGKCDYDSTFSCPRCKKDSPLRYYVGMWTNPMPDECSWPYLNDDEKYCPNGPYLQFYAPFFKLSELMKEKPYEFSYKDQNLDIDKLHKLMYSNSHQRTQVIFSILLQNFKLI